MFHLVHVLKIKCKKSNQQDDYDLFNSELRQQQAAEILS